jgi:hypothetical protein
MSESSFPKVDLYGVRWWEGVFWAIRWPYHLKLSIHVHACTVAQANIAEIVHNGTFWSMVLLQLVIVSLQTISLFTDYGEGH